MSFTSRRFIVVLVAMALAAARAGADEAEDQYAVAAGHYAQGRWQLAVDEFKTFLHDYAEHTHAVQAVFFSGEALVQLGQFDTAQAQFEQLLERYPKSRFARQAMFRRAEAAYVAGQPKRARTLLDEFHAKYPSDDFNEYVLPYLAELMLDEHNADGAEAARKLFAQTIDQYPQGALLGECQLGLAKADEALGRVDTARRAYQDLAANHEALREQARFHLGILENAAGEYDAALQALDPLVAASSESPLGDKARLERGWALYKLRRYAEAEACFTELIERDATNVEPRYWLGLVLAADRRWAAAIEPLAKVEATATNPTRVMQCRAALAICQARTDHITEARAAYAAFESSQPGPELWNSTTYQLAEAAFTYNSLWAADLFRSLTKTGNSKSYVALGLSGLAWCQFQSEDAAGSAATFERLLQEHADDPLAAEAALVRGQALEKLGQSDPALTMYELVIEKYPHSRQLGEALWRAARLQQKLDRAGQAEALYRRLAELRPPFAHYDSLLFHWSQVLEELKQTDEAEQLIERLRRDWPASPHVVDATYRLAERELARKNYDHCWTLVHEIVQIDPPVKILPHALFLQGRLAVERAQWDEVRAPLERLIHDFPDSALVLPARYWMAEAAYRQKDYPRAAGEFADLDRDGAGHKEKWLAMVPLRNAQSLAQLGQWTESLAAARSIAQRFPDFEEQYEADYLIGRALATQAEFSAARESYNKVLRSPSGGKSETAAMAQWMIGETFFHQENYDAAIAAYLRVEILFAFPQWQAGALLQAGKCQEVLGRWKDAAATYARLVQSYPETEFTDEAKRRLSVAQQRSTGKRS
jgi:TolA-binding protein